MYFLQEMNKLNDVSDSFSKMMVSKSNTMEDSTKSLQKDNKNNNNKTRNTEVT